MAIVPSLRKPATKIRKSTQSVRKIQYLFQQQLIAASNKKVNLIGKQLNPLNSVMKRLTELQKSQLTKN